jgi:hypothetical protein
MTMKRNWAGVFLADADETGIVCSVCGHCAKGARACEENYWEYLEQLVHEDYPQATVVVLSRADWEEYQASNYEAAGYEELPSHYYEDAWDCDNSDVCEHAVRETADDE